MIRTGFFLLSAVLAVPVLLAQDVSFKRGDANASDVIDLSDAVFALNFLFNGGPTPGCLDTADMNDDGKLDISDASSLLGFLFLGRAAPPAPFPGCGVDPTPDGHTCLEYPHCSSCLGQADLDAIIAEKIDPIVCIPGGGVDPAMVGVFEVTVCPVDLAKPCPGPDSATNGCPVELTQLVGALDVALWQVTLHIKGKAANLPIHIKDTNLGVVTNCMIDILFEGDVIVPFTAEPAGGLLLTITDLLEPSLENADVTLSTKDTTPLCKALVALQDLFVGDVIMQLQAASVELIAGLKDGLVGKMLCPAAP